MNTDNQYDERPARRNRGRGIGTVIACFAIAIGIAAVLDDDHHHRPRVSVAYGTDKESPDDIDTGDGHMTYKINRGHVVIVPTTAAMKIEMDDDLRARTKITTTERRVTIKVEDESDDDEEIRIFVPHAERCRIDLAAGLLEVNGLPCTDNDLSVRSGKMDVEGVPAAHGRLSGSVSVGTVSIDAGTEGKKRSSGIGELHADVPGSAVSPTLTARVDVGMLTVEVE